MSILSAKYAVWAHSPISIEAAARQKEATLGPNQTRRVRSLLKLNNSSSNVVFLKEPIYHDSNSFCRWLFVHLVSLIFFAPLSFVSTYCQERTVQILSRKWIVVASASNLGAAVTLPPTPITIPTSSDDLTVYLGWLIAACKSGNTSEAKKLETDSKLDSQKMITFQSLDHSAASALSSLREDLTLPVYKDLLARAHVDRLDSSYMRLTKIAHYLNAPEADKKLRESLLQTKVFGLSLGGLEGLFQ